jgi:hypothetical protein
VSVNVHRLADTSRMTDRETSRRVVMRPGELERAVGEQKHSLPVMTKQALYQSNQKDSTIIQHIWIELNAMVIRLTAQTLSRLFRAHSSALQRERGSQILLWQAFDDVFAEHSSVAR